MELLIKNGVVFDPLNKINGEVMDVAVKNGKIVEKVNESTAKVIDASNKLVMPGGVDLHSHYAGSKVNAGRILRPEDHYKDLVPKTKITRAGTGYSVPSSFVTGYRYAEMGYTTVMEAANPALKMLHVHDEFNDVPIVDKSAFIIFDNNWFVLDYLSKGKIEECAAFVAWILQAIKGYAIKIVDPGCAEKWKWGGRIRSLDEEVKGFNITPREIVKGLCKVANLLNHPHSIHVHTILLGVPGNIDVTLDTMKSVSGEYKDRPAIHMTHIQFHGYEGKSWINLASGAERIANYVNKSKHVSLDLGQIVFTDTTTMTADGSFEFELQSLTGNKWVNADVEVETGAGVVPITYKRSNYVHAVMWAIGLEVALMVKDPWKISMTTDHPNGGPFTTYPRVVSWLMSKKARAKIYAKLPRMARTRTILGSIDKELSWYDIAIITRAGNARLLGISKAKGHLGLDADADIAIYDINPKEVDPSKDYKKVRRALRWALYTIKGGEIVVKDGQVTKSVQGKTFWLKPKVNDDLISSVVKEIKQRFEDYYTLKLENYVVPETYLAQSQPLEVKAKI